MADNIFDAQRDRRIQNLRQQSVSNIVRTNPNLRGVLTRYEDAEVSRLKLLELQRNRTKKITAGERALLKTLRKGRRATGGKGGKQKKEKAEKTEPVKSQTQIEVDAEEKRERMRQEKIKLTQQDRFLELEDLKQQREFIANERGLQQRELQRQDTFISGQNRIAADQQIAQFNQAQENFRANQRGIDRIADRQLQQDRVDLQRRQIDVGQIENRRQRGLEHRRLNNDRDRYNADVQRAAIERDQQAIRADAEIQGIRERVAADNARQYAELQATQQLQLEQLAVQQRDNEARVRLEQNRIDNQRAVDAERAITDREREQTLQSGLDALHRSERPRELPAGRGLVEDADLSSGSDVGPVAQDARRVVVAQSVGVERPDLSRVLQGADDSLRAVNEDGSLATTSTPSSHPSQQFIGQDRVEAALERTTSERRRSVEERGIREGSLTPSEQFAADQFFLQEIHSGSSVDPESEGSHRSTLSSSSSSEDSVLRGAHPDVQRNVSILSGSPSPLPRSPSPRSPSPERDPATGLADPSGRAQRERELRSRAAQGLEPSANLRSQRRPDGSLRERPLAITGGSTTSSGEQEEFLPGQIVGAVGGAVGTGLGAAGRLAGGAVGGVAQGIYEQLPGAGDVGAAVGRGGIRLAGGIASAAYQGLAGGAAEPEPDSSLDRP
jgi:hypothetical protein